MGHTIRSPYTVSTPLKYSTGRYMGRPVAFPMEIFRESPMRCPTERTIPHRQPDKSSRPSQYSCHRICHGTSHGTYGIPSLLTLTQKFYTCFFNRSNRSSHHQPHTHTATRPHTHTKYHTALSYKALTLAWLYQLLLLAASQRGEFLVLLASSV